MRSVLLIVSLCFSCSIIGQIEKRDSLLLYAQQLDSIAEYNYNIGNDSVAIIYANRALEIINKVHGSNTSNYAHILSNIAKYQYEVGNYQEGKENIMNSIHIQKSINQHTKNYAEALDILSNYLSLEGDFLHAIEKANESVRIYKDIYGINSIEAAIAIGNLAEIYYDYGFPTKTVLLCKEALTLFPDSMLHNDNYATLLCTQCKAKTDLGLYIEALEDAKQSYDIFVSLYGEEHLSCVTMLSNMSTICSYLGNYSDAIKYGQKALNLYEQNYGMEHPYYIITLMNIADYKYDEGNFSECFSLAEKTDSIISDSNTFPMYYYIEVKLNISKLYRKQGKYDNALKCTNEAIRSLQQSKSFNSLNYAFALMELAEINSSRGNHNKAIKWAHKSLKIMSRFYEKSNIRYSQFLDLLSNYYSENKNYKEAVKYAIASMNNRKNYVVSTFSSMSSLQRQNLWNNFRRGFFYEAGLAYRYRSPQIISEVYNTTCLLAKGLLLCTEISMQKLIEESKDCILINQYLQILSLKEHYNKICELPLNTRSEDIDSLIQEIQRREIELINKSKSYGNFINNINVSWKNIQQKLGSKDIAIEFLDFPIKNDSVIYVALTVRKGYNYPHFIPLFDLEQIRAIKECNYYINSKLGNLIWGPLLPELKGVKNIYFSPTGALYNIGIEYLPGMENYNIFRLSSTRELVTNRGKLKTGKYAVLYGGLDYDASIDSLTSKKSLTILNETFKEHADVRGLGLRGGKEPLKHTKIEVDKIGEELNKAQWICLLDTASLGTEESFKSLSGRKINCLHISTHGFYYTKEEADNAQYKFMLLDDLIATTSEDKALTRSGLILSGANHILAGDTLPDNVEDGILTAKEIANVDLRGLDLVVLSACQTGLGDISQGEGVFGLQRGFKKAGANSILMSLWEVNDEATQILMTQFYKNLVSGQTKRQSLLSAQKYLREFNNRQYNEPKYWAAFILLDGIN